MSWIIKHPSAWIPIAMSLTVLTIILISFAMFGAPAREPDEGTAAHFFQIWLGLEVLSVALFAIKWVPQRPKQTFFVLVLQILAMLAAMFPVHYFKL